MDHPVVLIHGMWCTGANWQRVRDVLEPRGYRCVAPTLPAHEPTSDQPLQVARQSLRDYLHALERVVEQEQFERPPILIGHSMGALLAQQLASRIKPLALVLLTPAAPWGINGLRWSSFVAFARWMFSGLFWRKAYKPGPARVRTSLFNGLSADRQKREYEALVHESGRAIFEVGFWWADFSRASAVRTSEVECPVYVVSCGADRLTPASVVRKVIARYRGAAQRYYPERGHWVINDEETEEMMHSICGWLRPIEQRYERAKHGK